MTTTVSSRRWAGRLGIFSAVAGLMLAGFVGAQSATAASGTTTRWVPERMCGHPAPGHASCYGERLVRERVKAGSGGKAPAVRRATADLPSFATGPAGGYTPGDLATAYGVNAATATSQTVAIVDAFDDPTVRADLNSFDAHYGLPAETSTSFRVVNQTGGTTPPSPDQDWAGEITLDVQAVRGLCHACKILLVEANNNQNANLAAAVNYAAAHAKIVSNSYGGPETDPANTSAIRADYNHQGVAILASTGDDGWYDWDQINLGGTSNNVPEVPASYNTVVGVGGASLYLNPNGTRAGEQVWNGNGPFDSVGNAFANTYGITGGAAGSGCSTLYNAQLWQQKVAGYGGLGCGSTRRNGVDIAAVADPFTGFDICQGFGNTTGACGWETIGGTSLATPVVAALWALAGGPGGVKYPALSLYGHVKSAPSNLYDITIGGTGACDTATPSPCAGFFGAANPNTLGFGLVDCVWGASGTRVLANRYQCYAEPGYDGVSGVGTPKGVTAFKAMSPTAAITRPSSIVHGHAASFSGSASRDPFPGGSITGYAWEWGDGHTSTGKTESHTYANAGTYTITLAVTDNYARTGSRSVKVTVR